MKCPFCDVTGKRLERLVDHMVLVHGDVYETSWHAASAGFQVMYQRKRNETIYCWCGWNNRMRVGLNEDAGCFLARNQFCEHLEQKGGVEAHWLEMRLGIVGE